MPKIEAGSQISDYEIVELLRHGGSGSVYVARDVRDGSRVALKIPDSSYLGDIPSWERFRREVALAQRLDHPSIAKIREASDDPERPFLAVEFVEGLDLQEYIRQHGPLPVDQAITLSICLCRALEYVHGQRVIHRDLKPANIIIQENGLPRLVDFGIAKPLDMKRITWKGFSKTFGTPSYMAPEQVQGGRSTPATDIYALGTILHEMLAGRPPFEGDNAFQVMNQQATKPPPPIRSMRPDVPEWLGNIILRALEKKPQHRYSSAAEFRKDLESRTAPLPPPEPSAAEGSPRFIWGLVAAVTGIALLIVFLAALRHHV